MRKFEKDRHPGLSLRHVLAGCNTVEGIGKDIQKGGEKPSRRRQEEVNPHARNTVHQGLVRRWTAPNVDTDAIIPKQFLKSIKRTASAPTCSTSGATWTAASPARTTAQAQPRLRAQPAALPGRVHPAGAQELRLRLQREHAPWALEQYGFRAIIAPSFADIFFNNCFKNGLLPIVLPPSAGGCSCSTRCCLPGYRSRRPEAPGDHQADGTEIAFDVSPSAATACSTALTTSA